MAEGESSKCSRTSSQSSVSGRTPVPFVDSQTARCAVDDKVAAHVNTDRGGERAALEPMQMDILPIHQLPQPADLPGTLVGQGSIGDATIVGTVLSTPPAGVDGDGQYLAVSPRTPYNRYPIPFLPGSAQVPDAGFDGALRQTLDPEIGYHHGAVVDGLSADDTVTGSVEAAAGVARHEGYETAFLESGSVALDEGI
jgi:hypothetical protein